MSIKTELNTFFTSHAKGQKICEALCDKYNYQEEIEDSENLGEMIANTQSKEDYAVDKTIGFFKDNYISYKANTDSVREQAIADARAEMSGL